MSINIAAMIDHTVLKPDTTTEQIIKLAKEAKEFGFASVCVNPAWVKTAFEVLKDTPEIKVCTVIGFPLGANTTEIKALEAQKAVEQGAGEVDMVINVGALKDGQSDYVKEDIQAVVEAVKGKALVKVILETSLLSEEEKIQACKLSAQAGAHFVKTSTGFSTGGATVEDVSLMRKTVGPQIGVKASGGVRNREDALKMIEAGANRIGTSSGIAILQDVESKDSY